MERAPEFRSFPKSWGSEFIREGEVQFRLWAPGERQIALRLGGEDTPMERNEEGWFELLATGVEPGAEYNFVLPDGLVVPDPASRGQAGDVNGPSLVIDPTDYAWQVAEWTGRPWEEAVVYELHIGTFTPEGTFLAAIDKLEHLARLGVTMVEIMPVAQFAGRRGWGYDGVLLYAPHSTYGTPEEMKAFIDAAHGHGLMVALDVVYNHFGPEGNYLPRYAPDFFHPERHTPWGAAIAYEKEPVRRFFIENALYWLEEFHLDGLRFDAIDHIRDDSETDVLVEMAERIRQEITDRPIHLTTEDNRNITRLHERGEGGRVQLFTGEWNDDFHNVAHVIATAETEGYYADFEEDPWGKFARALAEGFAYQGETSIHGGGKPRGKPSAHLPPAAFVDFIQNHDQIGNRAFGDRLTTLADQEIVQALLAILLLSPHIPLMFMGEEWGETVPFFFFTDFHGELATAVREGRRKEFASFTAFGTGEEHPEDIPDPNAAETFEKSRIDWEKAESEGGRAWLALVGELLRRRCEHVVPFTAKAGGNSGRVITADEGVIAVSWSAGGDELGLRANLSGTQKRVPGVAGEVIHAQPAGAATIFRDGELPPYSVIVTMAHGRGGRA